MQAKGGPHGERNKATNAVAEGDVMAGVAEYLNEGKSDAGRQGPALRQ